MASEDSGKGEPSKLPGGREDSVTGEPPKPKPILKRLNQNNGASPRGQDVKLGSPFGNRLHSFKGQRDLTLGGKTIPDRKKFVPNLNVQRQIKKEPDGNSSEKKEKRDKNKNHKHDKHEKKDRNKNRPELIQTMGSVFAEGLGGDGIKRRGGGQMRSESSNCSREQLQRPKLEMRHDMKFDKEDEKERLQALLRDDFIDDLSKGNYVPVQLPMVDTGKIFKEEIKVEKDEEDQIKPKLLNKVRSELDSDDDDDPEVVAPAPAPKAVIETKPDIHKEIDIADLVKTQKGDLLFIQLPDHLPGSLPAKTEPETEQSPRCTLTSLPEGQIGKLQIRRSGRCQLAVGDHLLDVEMGTKVGFLQDAVSVKVPEEGVADLTVLGHVKHRLVVTPNWRHLLSKAGLDSEAA